MKETIIMREVVIGRSSQNPYRSFWRNLKRRSGKTAGRNLYQGSTAKSRR